MYTDIHVLHTHFREEVEGAGPCGAAASGGRGEQPQGPWGVLQGEFPSGLGAYLQVRGEGGEGALKIQEGGVGGSQ